MPTGIDIESDEQADILEMFEASIAKGYSLAQTYSYIAKCVGRDPDTVRNVMRRLKSTTKLAEAKLRAGSDKLVERLLEKANNDEIMDILTRPNIGVLAPKKAEQSGGGGFFLSVGLDSLGAVKVGMAALPPQEPKALAPVSGAEQEGGEAPIVRSSHPLSADAGVIDVTPEATAILLKSRHQEALAAAKARIAVSQKRLSARHGSSVQQNQPEKPVRKRPNRKDRGKINVPYDYDK